MVEASTFPSAGQYEIRSTPIFILTSDERTELVICRASMTIETQDSVKRGDRNEVDVDVTDWVATGQSKMLGGPIEFRFVQNGAKRSRIVGGRESDFPARLEFEVNYQLTTQRGTIEGLTGRAVGEIRAFPPAPGDVFTVEKNPEIAGLQVSGVACAHAGATMDISLPG